MTTSSERRPPTILVWADLKTGDALPHASDEIAALQALDGEGHCNTVVHVQSPWKLIGPTLLEVRPDIFHFIGHGDSQGRLLVIDDGLSSAKEPSELKRLMQAAPKAGPRGIFLNSCHSSRWSPHHVPSGGWQVAMDRAVGDEVAMLFAEAFYRNMLIPLPAPDPEDAFRMTVAQLRDSGAFDEEMVQSVWVSESDRPPIAEYAAKVHEFLRTVFNRSAFRDSACNELSFSDLGQALVDVQAALTTGNLVTRHDPTIIIRVNPILLQEPDVAHFVDSVSRRINMAHQQLLRFQDAFPNVSNWVAGSGNLALGPTEQAMALLDSIDETRNKVLRLVNRYMKRFDLPPFPLIKVSSKTYRQRLTL